MINERPAVTYDRSFFHIRPVFDEYGGLVNDKKIIIKNIGDLNYGNEGHFE